jgi:carbon storage regulator
MLVLTRKVEQKIRIGTDVVITVLKVQGDQVSIGIEAPRELQIVREELLATDSPHSAIRSKKKNLSRFKKAGDS